MPPMPPMPRSLYPSPSTPPPSPIAASARWQGALGGTWRDLEGPGGTNNPAALHSTALLIGTAPRFALLRPASPRFAPPRAASPRPSKGPSPARNERVERESEEKANDHTECACVRRRGWGGDLEARLHCPAPLPNALSGLRRKSFGLTAHKDLLPCPGLILLHRPSPPLPAGGDLSSRAGL